MILSIGSSIVEVRHFTVLVLATRFTPDHHFTHSAGHRYRTKKFPQILSKYIANIIGRELASWYLEKHRKISFFGL